MKPVDFCRYNYLAKFQIKKSFFSNIIYYKKIIHDEVNLGGMDGWVIHYCTVVNGGSFTNLENVKMLFDRLL